MRAVVDHWKLELALVVVVTSRGSGVGQRKES
jgi:hypothetical protein